MKRYLGAPHNVMQRLVESTITEFRFDLEDLHRRPHL
jgi:hypothetical protein